MRKENIHTYVEKKAISLIDFRCVALFRNQNPQIEAKFRTLWPL